MSCPCSASCRAAPIHTLAAAFGLSALLATSAHAFTVVKIAGAVYLVYLGIRMLFERAEAVGAPVDVRVTKASWAIFRAGLLSNVLNPKVALFFMAFLPQFVAPDAESRVLTFLFLGAVFIFNGTLWCLFLVWCASAMSRRLRRQPSSGTILKRATGALVRGSRTQARGEQVKQQAAVIPFRGTGKKLEICLIRKKGSKKKWGIPKGFVDRGDTTKETALKEAGEEAGLKGRLVGDPVGSYEYQKWGVKLDVTVYLMEVKDEDDDWDEADFRERHWTSLQEAAELLERHPVRPLLKNAEGEVLMSGFRLRSLLLLMARFVRRQPASGARADAARAGGPRTGARDTRTAGRDSND